MRRTAALCVTLVVLPAAALAAPEKGKVTLPMQLWEGMLEELERAEAPEAPPMQVTQIERRIDGRLRKGLLTADMNTRFEVLDGRGHVRVPVLDASASVGDVRLDGRRTSLLREGPFYTIGVDEPGTYTLELRFYWGKEQDRFARNLRFRLPPAGPTRLSVVVPEEEIDVHLDHGALTAQQRVSGGTRLDGQLDPAGVVDLSWARRLTHRATGAVRSEARLYTLFTVQEALVHGLALFDISVLEGETDRVDLQLPRDIEVVRVQGDAVLQWHTEEQGGGKLAVLFRYLVEDAARVAVYFQFPVDNPEAVRLRMPLPPIDSLTTGALGVQAPAGLNVKVVSTEAAKVLALRDLPVELTDLTASPLLFGYSFEAVPKIALSVARHDAVELTSTVIDDIQASTVVIEDGAEITKLKLRIRNNTRQYLRIELPNGAVLTHSLIDGEPVRPAQAGDGAALLFPLRQSERIDEARGIVHTVAPGETLTDLANFYYSDPNEWRAILENNPETLSTEWDLAVGQQLYVPPTKNAKVQESSFVIELAYKRRHDRLGSFGRLDVALPQLDVGALNATWHLYLPTSLAPLWFDSTLTQYSAIRYDPFRRVEEFLRRARWVRSAWAGSRYKSILEQRKVIYKEEAALARSRGKMVLASFPLVGERYRFKGAQLGTEVPTITATYVTRELGPPLRWGMMLATLILGLLVLNRSRDRRTWMVAVAALVGMLLVAHFVLGLHRRIVWGADLALLLTWVRLRAGGWWRSLRQVIESPWLVVHWLRLANVAKVFGAFLLLVVVLEYPLLLSSVVFLVAGLWWWRKGSRTEVSRA